MLPSSLTALVNQAAFGDACGFLATKVYAGRPFNVTACRAFNGGVLKRGFSTAISEWVRNAEEAGDRQIRG